MKALKVWAKMEKMTNIGPPYPVIEMANIFFYILTLHYFDFLLWCRLPNTHCAMGRLLLKKVIVLDPESLGKYFRGHCNKVFTGQVL